VIKSVPIILIEVESQTELSELAPIRVSLHIFAEIIQRRLKISLNPLHCHPCMHICHQRQSREFPYRLCKNQDLSEHLIQGEKQFCGVEKDTVGDGVEEGVVHGEEVVEVLDGGEAVL